MNKKYIVPLKSLNKVQNVINKIERRRERLINENQITEEDFPPMNISFEKIDRENISSYNEEPYIFTRSFNNVLENPQDYIVVNFEGTMPVINKWKVLGEITPLEDSENDYTLHSYSEKDMPLQYRNLENPTECEHCNTNRKRNRTYIIKNTESEEVLQVGGSCMKDFIDKTSLSHLMSLSNLMDDLEKTLSSNIEYDSELILFGKNEYLAIQLATIELLQDMVGEGEVFNSIINNRYWNSLLLSLYDEERKDSFLDNLKNKKFRNSEVWKKVLEEVFITEDHRDKADEILDFYEEVDLSLFRDNVFNMAQVLNLNSDFLTEKETLSLTESVLFYDAYTNKKEKLKDYFANYNYGATIEQNLISNKPYKKEEVLACLLAIYSQEDFIQYNKSQLGNPSTFKKLEHIMIPELKEKYIKELSLEDLESYNSKMSKIPNYSEYVEEAKEMIDWFSENRYKSNSMYITNLIKAINDQDEYIIAGDFKNIVFAANYYKQEQKKEELIKEVKKNKIEELEDFSLSVGDKIEKVSLIFKEEFKVNSSFYGPLYINKFEDEFGVLFTILTNSKLEEAEVNKWVNISGNVSELRNYNNNYTETVEKQTKLNRVKFLSEPSDNSLGDTISLAGKYSTKELQLMEEKSYKKNDKNLFMYIFEDNGGNEYKLKSPVKIGLEETKYYEMAIKSSKEKNFIYNFDDKLNKQINKFSENYESKELTEKQAEKHFGVEKTKRRPKI